MILEIYTDGSCLKNPGNGAFAVVLINTQSLVVISGFFNETTNNQMELLGAIEGLKYLMINNIDSQAKIHTDSQYVKNGIEQWIFNWQKNNWKTANGSPVKNQELWRKLYEFNSKTKPLWQWVRGHSDNEYNNIVDFVANHTARTQKPFSDINLLQSKFPKTAKFEIKIAN